MTISELRKRHSPFKCSCPNGISDCKRIKLIENFEKLSLSDNNTTIKYDTESFIKDMCNPVPKVNLPKTIKGKIVRNVLAVPRDEEQMENHEIIYSRVYNRIREESLNLILWIDWRKIIYKMWLHWSQSIPWNYIYKNYPHIYENEVEYDNMRTSGQNNFNYYNNYIPENTNMDIIMDY